MVAEDNPVAERRAWCPAVPLDANGEAQEECACGRGGHPPEDPEDARERARERAEVVVALKALADPTRLQIVRELGERGEVCACDFAPCCTLSQPTISHHLSVLRSAGLVTCERRGQWVYYRADPERLHWLRRQLP